MVNNNRHYSIKNIFATIYVFIALSSNKLHRISAQEAVAPSLRGPPPVYKSSSGHGSYGGGQFSVAEWLQPRCDYIAMSGACVTRVTGFDTCINGCVKNHNIRWIQTASVAECMIECYNYGIGCVGVEHFTLGTSYENWCVLSSSSDTSGCDNNIYQVAFYPRNFDDPYHSTYEMKNNVDIDQLNVDGHPGYDKMLQLVNNESCAPAPPRCDDYDGIDTETPSTRCCPPSCGDKCGAVDCHLGTDCCSQQAVGKVCGEDSLPCYMHLPPI